MKQIRVSGHDGQQEFSAADGMNGGTVIVVVTPTYNSAQFLDDTILSVVSQSGNFYLRYHIQDGGSSDATLDIVRRWERLFVSGNFPILCAGLTFSYDSSPDTGMYQAINRGVAHARPDGAFLMGWINSDDRLAPGALAAIAGIYGQLPEVNFTCARVSMIDQHGVITGVNLSVGYDRQNLSAGAHDGRQRSFVMQEGTFWRSGLWDRVGGLDERFRLAGDWDLWRRFARHAALFTIDSVLGFHRRHDKQLSADLGRYHAEVDAAERQPIPQDGPARDDVGDTLKINLDTGRWEKRKARGMRLGMPVVCYDGDGPMVTRAVELMRGARLPEGPYPEASLPGGMRWVDDAQADAIVTVPYPGLWRMHLRIRNWRPDLRLLVSRGSTVCLDVMPGAGADNSENMLIASLWLDGGDNEIRLDAVGQFDSPGWLFILLEWYVLATVAGDQMLLAGRSDHGQLVETARDWPTISIVLHADQQRLDQRLDAILAQGYPALDISVVDENSSAMNRQIMSAYAPAIDRVVVVEGGHRHLAIGRAIDLSHGIVVAVLDDAATLAPGALFTLGTTFRTRESADLVVGITVDAMVSMPDARNLPLLTDGPLPVRDVLRTGMQAKVSGVFDRGALFFARRIWQATGRQLMAGSFSCAAFDFWVRSAEVGATLRTLPVDLVYRRIAADHRASRHPPAPDDVRSHAATLAGEDGPALEREAGVTTRSELKIVMLDGGDSSDRLSDGCRRLAIVLAAASQRVVCLISGASPAGENHLDRSEFVLQAIASERPDLVVILGESPSESWRVVIARLVAGNTPTINVRERRAPIARAAIVRGRDCFCIPQSIALSPPGDRILAEPYGILAYGGVGCRADGLPDDRSYTLHGLRVGVDPLIYRPNRRAEARRILGLAVDDFIILAVADDPIVLSPRLAAAVAAFETLDCVAKLLMISDYVGELPSTGAPIKRADDCGADGLRALFHAAADAVVSLWGAAAEQPLVQAAASGTPAIADGADLDGTTIAEGPFGLRLPAWTAPLLAEAFRRLHADQKLHSRLSRAGRAYARSNHSLEAAAWSFATLVRRLPGLQGLSLAPELRFPARAAPFAVRSLDDPRARPFLDARWHVEGAPLSSHETATDADGTPISCSGKPVTIYLRARRNGLQRLRVRAASRVGTLLAAVAVNGDDRARLEFVARDCGFCSHIVHAEFFCGLNRVDFSLVAEGQPTVVLMLRSLDLDDELVLAPNTFPLKWQPLIGFAETAPIDGNGAPTYWIDSPSATLRLWSEVEGLQQLRLFLKNYAEPQAVEVAVDDVVVASIDAPTTDFLTLTKVFAIVTVDKGWNLISLTTRDPVGVAEFGHHLLMLVADISFAGIEELRPPDDNAGGPSEPC